MIAEKGRIHAAGFDQMPYKLVQQLPDPLNRSVSLPERAMLPTEPLEIPDSPRRGQIRKFPSDPGLELLGERDPLEGRGEVEHRDGAVGVGVREGGGALITALDEA